MMVSIWAAVLEREPLKAKKKTNNAQTIKGTQGAGVARLGINAGGIEGQGVFATRA